MKYILILSVLLLNCTKPDEITTEPISYNECRDKVLSVSFNINGAMIITRSDGVKKEYIVPRSVADEYHPYWTGYKHYYCG